MLKPRLQLGTPCGLMVRSKLCSFGHLFTPLRGRSRPHRVKGKHTHIHTDIDIHPCIQTDVHAETHPDIYTWEKCVISALPARPQPVLAEPGTSNLCSRSREDMLTGLSLSVSVRLSRSVSLSVSLSVSVWQDTRTNARTMSVRCNRHRQRWLQEHVYLYQPSKNTVNAVPEQTRPPPS